jgi:hypothetical protein
VTGADPDPPQAARSSAAPIVITGAKRRFRVFSDSRIMSAARVSVESGAYPSDDGRSAGAFNAPHQASSLSRFYYIIHRSKQAEQRCSQHDSVLEFRHVDLISKHPATTAIE